tara:strand:- start:612 stop:965 length:354 start_codon:yes stop_codon:yes gene_type:complete
MSLLQFNKECPHCQHHIVVRLDQDKAEINAKWTCPACHNALLFGDFSFSEKELLAVAAGQAMVTAAHSIKTNALLEAQIKLQKAQVKTLKDIYWFLAIVLVILPLGVGFIAGFMGAF